MRTRFGVNSGVRRGKGFSLLELLIVLAITMVIAAMVAPKMTVIMANYRLKSTASSVAGMLQQARIASVRTNTPIQALPVIVNGMQQVYVDLDGDAQLDPGEPTIVMPKKISFQNTSAPANATNGLAVSNVATTYYNTPPRFNARGLPCVMVAVGAGQVCRNLDAGNNLVGFAYYLKSDNMFGQTQWAAITVTPAGRIKTWMYNGTKFQ